MRTIKFLVWKSGGYLFVLFSLYIIHDNTIWKQDYTVYSGELDKSYSDVVTTLLLILGLLKTILDGTIVTIGALG